MCTFTFPHLMFPFIQCAIVYNKSFSKIELNRSHYIVWHSNHGFSITLPFKIDASSNIFFSIEFYNLRFKHTATSNREKKNFKNEINRKEEKKYIWSFIIFVQFRVGSCSEFIFYAVYWIWFWEKIFFFNIIFYLYVSHSVLFFSLRPVSCLLPFANNERIKKKFAWFLWLRFPYFVFAYILAGKRLVFSWRAWISWEFYRKYIQYNIFFLPYVSHALFQWYIQNVFSCVCVCKCTNYMHWR